jgi:hypothetical protein
MPHAAPPHQPIDAATAHDEPSPFIVPRAFLHFYIGRPWLVLIGGLVVGVFMVLLAVVAHTPGLHGSYSFAAGGFVVHPSSLLGIPLQSQPILADLRIGIYIGLSHVVLGFLAGMAALPLLLRRGWIADMRLAPRLPSEMGLAVAAACRRYLAPALALVLLCRLALLLPFLLAFDFFGASFQAFNHGHRILLAAVVTHLLAWAVFLSLFRVGEAAFWLGLHLTARLRITSLESFEELMTSDEVLPLPRSKRALSALLLLPVAGLALVLVVLPMGSAALAGLQGMLSTLVPAVRSNPLFYAGSQPWVLVALALLVFSMGAGRFRRRALAYLDARWS